MQQTSIYLFIFVNRQKCNMFGFYHQLTCPSIT
jgi:hypothetical protein